MQRLIVAGRSCGADFIFIPEDPPSEDNWEDSMCTMIQSVSVPIPSCRKDAKAVCSTGKLAKGRRS